MTAEHGFDADSPADALDILGAHRMRLEQMQHIVDQQLDALTDNLQTVDAAQGSVSQLLDP